MKMRQPGRAEMPLAIAVESSPPPDWNALLTGDPATTFFHTPLWSDALRRQVPGVAPFWLIARSGGGCVGGLAAVLRRRGPCRVLQGHFEGTVAGPLTAAGLPDPERETVAAALLGAYAQRARRPDVLAASLMLPPAAAARWGAALTARGWTRRDVPAAVIPLVDGVEAVEYGVFPKNRRNERNRALRRGCTAGVTADPAVLAEYYPVYLAAARRWRITPTPEGLLRELLARGAGTVFLSWVRREGRVIGGHVCFRNGAEVVAWNGATRPEDADVFPATLLVWTDIVEACRGGAARLDLGGSGGSTTLVRFKELLGARLETRVCYETSSPLHRIVRRLRQRPRDAGDGATAEPVAVSAAGEPLP